MDKINKLAQKHLGQQNYYIDQYDPKLLVKIPRSYNRKIYQIDDNNLPFVGFDVWNAYEVSAITEKGLPVNGVMKIVIPVESKCLVESKSLKLYLNSFNMTKFGNSAKSCIELLENIIIQDLSRLLEVKVLGRFFQNASIIANPFVEFRSLEKLTNLDDITFSIFNSDKSLLKIDKVADNSDVIALKSDLLRSNCRVTNQPDWGDVFIYMHTNIIPDYKSIAQYLVSHRKVNHFHEEIAEMIYVHFLDIFNPSELMVACQYTRRGGIDINPIRANNLALITEDFNSVNSLTLRTIRQ